MDRYDGMNGMRENTFINVKNQSKKITAEVEIPELGAQGVLLAQGGRFGGWSLYVKDNKPAYTYNFLGLAQYTVASEDKLPAGKATVSVSISRSFFQRGIKRVSSVWCSTRCPFSLSRLVKVSDTGQVVYQAEKRTLPRVSRFAGRWNASRRDKLIGSSFV